MRWYATKPKKEKPKPPPLTAEQSQLVADNLGLAGWVVKGMGPERWKACGSRADAFQAAAVFLMRAAQLYDPATGNAFSTYALTCVKFAMWEHVRRLKKREKAATVSRTDLIGNEVEDWVEPFVVGAESHGDEEGLEFLLSMVANDRQRHALRLIYGAGLNGREAGREMGVSHQRVRQLERAAKAQLKRKLEVRERKVAGG